MTTSSLFSVYAETIRNLDLQAVNARRELPESLLLSRDGRLTTFYAPFDWTNRDARIVIVGITPGFSQASLALESAQRALGAGMAPDDALRAGKQTGGFGGEIRKHLVALLDHFELNQWLGLTSSVDLFGPSRHLLHTTSILRFPTFVGAENYNGTPSVLGTGSLRTLLLDHFVRELELLPKAVFVPMGPKVAEVMVSLAAQGYINADRVLDGLPHPSPANLERINYVLGRKPRAALSSKTNAEKLDEASAALRARIRALPALAAA